MDDLSPYILAFIAAVASATANFALIRWSRLHMRVTGDMGQGPQNFHIRPVTRIGGLGIVAGFSLVLALAATFPARATSGLGGDALRDSIVLGLCSIPAFGAGFAEDVTKKVGVAFRLLATMLSAGIAYFALDGALTHLGVFGFDFLLGFGLVSFAFTLVAVAGIANAFNIIDGCNGLAGMVSIFVLASLAYVSHEVGDPFLFGISLTLAAAVAGFLIWNFPAGRIFLGDGGAYFVGFMIGEISVLLVARHPEVSPWFPLLLVAYPVWETLFSIYRKRLIRGSSPGEPDGLHFHMLVYKRVVRWKVASPSSDHRVQRNSLTSPYLWGLSLLTIVPAILLWEQTVALAFWAFSFGFLYNWLYRKMARFDVPEWLIVRDGPTSEALIADDQHTANQE